MKRCNFCMVKDARKLAQTTGQVISVVPTPHKVLGGYDVLMHKPDEQPDSDKHWLMWLMGMSKKCCCGD